MLPLTLRYIFVVVQYPDSITPHKPKILWRKSRNNRGKYKIKERRKTAAIFNCHHLENWQYMLTFQTFSWNVEIKSFNFSTVYGSCQCGTRKFLNISIGRQVSTWDRVVGYGLLCKRHLLELFSKFYYNLASRTSRSKTVIAKKCSHTRLTDELISLISLIITLLHYFC